MKTRIYPPGTLTVPDDLDPPDHDERITYARGVALREIGDASWADTIVDAYLHPACVPDEFTTGEDR